MVLVIVKGDKVKYSNRLSVFTDATEQMFTKNFTSFTLHYGELEKMLFPACGRLRFLKCKSESTLKCFRR